MKFYKMRDIHNKPRNVKFTPEEYLENSGWDDLPHIAVDFLLGYYGIMNHHKYKTYTINEGEDIEESINMVDILQRTLYIYEEIFEKYPHMTYIKTINPTILKTLIRHHSIEDVIED